MEKNKNKKLIWLIMVLILIIIAMGGYILYDKVLKDDTSNNSNTTYSKDNSNTSSKNEIPDSKEKERKFSMSAYCPNNTCEKRIDIFNDTPPNDEQSVLKINLKNLNISKIAGTLSIGENIIDVSTLDQTSFDKIDGFSVYGNYILLYTSSKETITDEPTKCELRGYNVHILNRKLELISNLTGYTKDNAYEDFLISESELYYYTLTMDKKDATKSKITYNKIKFSDILNKNYDNSELISTTTSC